MIRPEVTIGVMPSSIRVPLKGGRNTLITQEKSLQLLGVMPVGSHDDPEPVEGVCAVRGHDAEERDLAADQEDEEGDGRPEDLLPEAHLPLWLLDLGQDGAEGLHQVQDLDCMVEDE